MSRTTSRSTESVPTIAGSLVVLGPLRHDLLALYTRWRNDFVVQRTKDDPPLPVTEDAYAAVVKEAGSDVCLAWFTVYEHMTMRPIGIAGLLCIDERHRTAEFAIQIGEADARGRGYGTETTQLVLEYAFATLGLHSVMLRVFAFNHAGRRAYARAGFRVIGVRRQSWRMGGELWDVVYMECLASAYPGTTAAGRP